jgi:hypothetical protein
MDIKEFNEKLFKAGKNITGGCCGFIMLIAIIFIVVAIL